MIHKLRILVNSPLLWFGSVGVVIFFLIGYLGSIPSAHHFAIQGWFVWMLVGIFWASFALIVSGMILGIVRLCKKPKNKTAAKAPKQPHIETEEIDDIRDRLLEMSVTGDVDGLVRGLNHKNPIARYCAAGGLMDIGASAFKAIPYLISAFLDDKDHSVKIEAARALVGIGPSAARPVFLAIVGTTSDVAQISMIKILRELGPEGVPFLVEIMKSFNDPLIQHHCETALKTVTGYVQPYPQDWIRWFDAEFQEWYRHNRNQWKPKPRNVYF